MLATKGMGDILLTQYEGLLLESFSSWQENNLYFFLVSIS